MVVVIGGVKGIGYLVCWLMVEEGVKVVVCDLDDVVGEVVVV